MVTKKLPVAAPKNHLSAHAPKARRYAKLVALYRLWFAGLATAAIVAQYFKSTGHAAFNPLNFFSYFTIDSNILAIIAFLVGAYFILAKKPAPSWFGAFRGAAVVYMVTTGIIFALLLRNTSIQNDFSLQWADDIMHVIFPMAVALEWLIVRTPKRLTWEHMLYWLAFPLIWLVYTLERGIITGWYPYPFLVPEDGYLRVVVACILVAACITIIGLLVRAATNITPVGATPAKKKRKKKE